MAHVDLTGFQGSKPRASARLARSLATLVISLALALVVASPAWAQRISTPAEVEAGQTFVISGSGFVPGAHIPCDVNTFIEVDFGVGEAVVDSHGNFTIEVRAPVRLATFRATAVCIEETLVRTLIEAEASFVVRPARHSVRDLGAGLFASALNPEGQMSGRKDVPGGTQAVQIPSISIVNDLEPAGSITSVASGISGPPAGPLRVVGSVGPLPKFWELDPSGTFVLNSLPLLTGGSLGQATDVSAAGIAGSSFSLISTGVQWKPSVGGFTAIALPFVPGDVNAFATGINAAGVLVGTGFTIGSTGMPGVLDHGVRWQPVAGGVYSVASLSPLPGDTRSYPLRVNEAGVAVGRSLSPEFLSRAVFWAPDGTGGFPPTALPGLGGGGSIANAINGAGEMVGSASRPDASSAGVVWSADGVQVVDLDTTLPAGTDFATIAATAVNDLGQIAVSAVEKSTGTSHALLLTPMAGGMPLVGQVGVSDGGFALPVLTVPPGGSVQWENTGTVAHTVTDTTGLNRFDSGALGPRRGFVASFPAAGSYGYRDTLSPALTGTVGVPIDPAPASGTTATPFQVAWASAVPTGLVEDVQIQRPGAADFADWRPAQTRRLAPFLPDGGVGTYSFRARLRDPATGAATDFSPPAAVPVTLAPELFLGPSVNQARFAPGETLRAAVAVSNPGLPTTITLFVGLLLPDGNTVVSFTATGIVLGQLSNPATLVPVATDVALANPFAVGAPDFLVYQLTGNEPPGPYTLFMVAVGPTGLVGLNFVSFGL